MSDVNDVMNNANGMYDVDEFVEWADAENIVDKFIDGLTPSNYFLTKSMEISKVTTSGTLWYTKKYIVLYDAIFLTRKIRTRDGLDEIKKNFENYIATLPESQREEAAEFFFPEHADMRKSDFKTYYKFAGEVDLDEGERSFYANVDKYYFVYLMNVGGQSGIKAYIREKLYQDDFVFANLKKMIAEYVKNHPDENINENQILNDYHAALRNERQILFYYGFFHSRNTGAGGDNEFASLTPVGELAVQANAKEFAILWEEQKIKMISQPVNVEFPSINHCPDCEVDEFKLNYSPYLSILRYLLVNGELPPKFYDRILSRTNNSNIESVIEKSVEYEKNLDKIEAVIEGYGLRTDFKPEDFEKEMKKYMLGVRDDLTLDHGEVQFGCISGGSNNSWKVDDADKLKKIVKIYGEIEKYKLKRYGSLFDDSERELKRKYYAAYSGDTYEMNHRIKMSWDLYNIKKDDIILTALLIFDYVMYENVELDNRLDFDNMYEYLKKNFGLILKSLNLSSKRLTVDRLKEIVNRMMSGTLQEIEYLDERAVDIAYVNKYSVLDTSDLMRKIKEVSEENVKAKIERKRDEKIINLIAVYYLANYSDENHLIKCECCGNTTFVKNNDEPYLEFHHLIPFGVADGPDHFENIFGLCPMCHRKMHSIKDGYKAELYDEVDANNHFEKKILDRLKDLYSLNILKSYQLEYALSEYMINEDEYNLILA